MAVDTVNGYVYGASIPRDSKAIIGGKAHKINYAYNKGGTALLASTVSEQLGIPVDYTVCVNLQASPRWWTPSAAWISRYPSIWTTTIPFRG